MARFHYLQGIGSSLFLEKFLFICFVILKNNKGCLALIFLRIESSKGSACKDWCLACGPKAKNQNKKNPPASNKRQKFNTLILLKCTDLALDNTMASKKRCFIFIGIKNCLSQRDFPFLFPMVPCFKEQVVMVKDLNQFFRFPQTYQLFQ